MNQSNLPDAPSITRLASHVVDQIAAGEVVDRPASIVKELVENATDAGATSVQVDIEGGGLGRITVTDDGVGMGEQDLHLSWQRHATSKLAEASDLFCIETFGFRGEALSSIASVSEMTITTRRAKDASGLSIRVKGSKLLEQNAVGCPVGTSIDIQHLFYNTPARRKFLRAPATEQAHVLDACLRTALGSQRVGVLLTSGHRRLLDLPPDARGRARIETALGKRVGALCEFSYADEGVQVRGFRSGPEVDRGDSKGIWLFVNGRYVRDKMLQRAILDAFRTLVQRGRYPIVVVFIDVDPASVDVNVHPQKLEVRFSEAGPVYRCLASALASSEQSIPLATAQVAGHRERVEQAVVNYSVSAQAEQPKSKFTQGQGPSASFEPSFPSDYRVPSELPEQVRAATAASLSSPQVPALAAQTPGVPTTGWELWPGVMALVIQDELLFYSPKHARQELAYQALMSHSKPSARALMLPHGFGVNQEFSRALDERGTLLSALGMEIQEVGPDRYLLRAVPRILGKIAPDKLVELSMPILASRAPPQDLQEKLVRAWVSCMRQDAVPLSPEEVPVVVQIETRKSAGDCGYRRSGILHRLHRDDIARRIAPVERR